MIRKKGAIISIMLILTSLIIPATSQTNTQEPFELVAIAGGFSHTTSLFKIEISENGDCAYSIMTPDRRNEELWMDITTMSLDENDMNEIEDAITSNGFFDLDSEYITDDILDGTFADLTISINGETHQVRTENTVVPGFDMIMKTINQVTPGTLDIYYNAIFNYQPDQPSRPQGPTEPKILKSYTFTSIAEDRNQDPLFYWFDWGDGTNSGWVGPFDAGDIGDAEHSFTQTGNVSITVKVRDDPNHDGDYSDGKESNVSKPLTIALPKSKGIIPLINHIFDVLFEKHPLWENIINLILQSKEPLFNDAIETIETQHSEPGISYVFQPQFQIIDSSQESEYQSLASTGGTRVDINDCAITVNIYIQIRGEGATVQLTKEIEQNIEDVWNGNWRVKCKEDCDPRTPGCTVTFDAHVVRMPPGEVLPGFHDITIVKDESDDGEGHVSSVQGARTPANDDRVLDSPRPNDNQATTGTWDTNEPANTYAHETGHLMGLDDTYPPHQTDFGDHIMNENGAVRQEDIDLIIEMSGVECPCECCPEEEDNDAPANKIIQPQNNTVVSSPLTVYGTADDGNDGSGIVKLSGNLYWSTGSLLLEDYIIDPPLRYVPYTLTIPIGQLINPGEWMIISIKAHDAADNIGEDEITVILGENGQDTTPPVTEKTIGEPNEEDGFLIYPFTPITLTATDDNSGVNYIHYEVWWDSNEDGIVDMEMADIDVPGDSVSFHMADYGVLYGVVELRYYAVDNAENMEDEHIQEHFVLAG